MERSLTVLLPVRNAQATLTATVSELLEVAADLTSQFELVIIDDGSQDATSEVAGELSLSFPQVHFVRHGRPSGREAAIRSGLRCSTGDMVLLRDDASGVGVDGIVRLWQATERQEVVVDLSRSACERRWARFSGGHEVGSPGYQTVDREAFQKLPTPGGTVPSQPARPNFISRTGNSLDGTRIDGT